MCSQTATPSNGTRVRCGFGFECPWLGFECSELKFSSLYGTTWLEFGQRKTIELDVRRNSVKHLRNNIVHGVRFRLQDSAVNLLILYTVIAPVTIFVSFIRGYLYVQTYKVQERRRKGKKKPTSSALASHFHMNDFELWHIHLYYTYMHSFVIDPRLVILNFDENDVPVLFHTLLLQLLKYH